MLISACNSAAGVVGTAGSGVAAAITSLLTFCFGDCLGDGMGTKSSLATAAAVTVVG